MTVQLAINGGPKSIKEPIPTIQDGAGRMIDEAELAELREVVETGCLSFLYGSKVKQFEEEFGELYGMPINVGVSSGTAALHTAVLYLNPEPGDEIIVSPITDMGSVIPILQQLAMPVFVDVDPVTQNMDPAKIEEAISPRTRAIIVTHIFGSPADMDPIMEIARKHDLFVVEDCAQSQLATYKGRLTGTIGDLGCFSFQQSKHMTMGDGGLVMAREDGRYGRMLRQCMDKGWPRERGGRDHLFLAPNYHMTELQAAVGLAQMRKLDRIVARRREAALRLDQRMKLIPAYSFVPPLQETFETYFFVGFRMDPAAFKVRMSDVVAALQAEGLPCFLGYPASKVLYKFPVFAEAKTFGTTGWPFTMGGNRRNWDYSDALCPVAEQLCGQTLVIWWSEGLTMDHVDSMADAMEKVAENLAVQRAG